MEKVFISQPMRGKTNEQILKERKRVTKALEDKGYEVIKSVFEDEPEEGKESVFYLGMSIELLSKADHVYFMAGWKEARGCKIEHDIAEQYGIDILWD